VPHVVVKLWPGKSEQQKTRLAQEITDSVMSVLNYGTQSVRLGLRKSNRRSGRRRCTAPISKPNGTSSYKKPGYNPLEK